MKKKRSVWIALLLGLLSSSVAFIYVGEPLLAALVPACELIAVAASRWTRLVFMPWGMTIIMVGSIVVSLVVFLMPALIAFRRRELVLTRLQSLPVYVLVLILITSGAYFLKEHRAQRFGFQPFRIPSKSMANTLKSGDFIVADTWAYRTSFPQRGDVVVYVAPDRDVKFVKRVIGVPGDSIAIKDGVVFVNGQPQQEMYIEPTFNVSTRKQSVELTVPPNMYFVMGDNRDASYDSRYQGSVPAANMIGRAEVIWLSWEPTIGIRWDRIGKRL